MSLDAFARGDGIQPDDTLVSLFRRVANAVPHCVAVADSQGSLTYAQLDGESDSVAESLRRQRVVPGGRIGLVARRSRSSIVGLLGILKAGCAYVPLDPSIPPKRRSHIIQEASISLIVDLHQESAECWCDHTVDPVAAADFMALALLKSDGDRRMRSDSAAYVIYTSGSTGVPKGCEVSHRNVLALLRSALPLFSPLMSDVWSVTHSLTFDFSVWELWGALATGGTAIMVDDATVIDPVAFSALLDDQGVTILNMVPSAFTALIASRQRRPATVRLIIFGGESVQLKVIQRFLETGAWNSGKRPEIFNMYGITETTVHSTIQRIGPAILSSAEIHSPIGKPLPHVTLKLFKSPGIEARDDEEGEICIGGESVSAGYVGKPELTAERFFTLTEPDGLKVRYYRSGDLARSGEYGLEYCGRIDRQVKLRGYRIELEEVQAAIEALPDVDAAAVSLERTQQGRPLLVAFIVPSRSRKSSGLQASVRRDLREELPSYMIPSHVLILDALPITASGKRDLVRLSVIWNDSREAGRSRARTHTKITSSM